jgi:hypothetical protein
VNQREAQKPGVKLKGRQGPISNNPGQPHAAECRVYGR